MSNKANQIVWNGRVDRKPLDDSSNVDRSKPNRETNYATIDRRAGTFLNSRENMSGRTLMSEELGQDNLKLDDYKYLFDEAYPASFADTQLPHVRNPHIKNYCFNSSGEGKKGDPEGSLPGLAATAAAMASVAAVTAAVSATRTAAAAERSAAAAERTAAAAERSAKW